MTTGTNLALVKPHYTAEVVAEKLSKEAQDAADAEISRQFYRMAIDYHTDKVDLSSLTKNINYALQGDGIYAIIMNRIGKFIVRQAECEMTGLPKQFNGNKLVLDVPRIPGVIYYQIKQFFTDISKDMGEAEAFCQVYYDLEAKEYVVHVPEQTVSKASVTYDAMANLSTVNSARYILVFEIHSHNTMNAFWSGTDNADEKDTRFYGVLGNLDKPEIGELFRTIVLGKYVDMNKNNIFDFSNDKLMKKSYVEEILAKEAGQEIDPAALVAALMAKPAVTYPATWRDPIKKPVYNYSNNYYNQTQTTVEKLPRRQWNNTTRQYDYYDAITGEPVEAWSADDYGTASWGKDTGTTTNKGKNWSGGGVPEYPNRASKKDKKNSGNYKGPGSESESGSGTDEIEDGYTRGYTGPDCDDVEVEIVDPESLIEDALTKKEYDDRFDLTTVEDEWTSYAVAQFVYTLDYETVYDLLDSIVEYGFQDVVEEYFAKEPKNKNKKGASKGKKK